MAKYATFNYGGGRPFPNPQKYGFGFTYPIFRPEYSLGKHTTLEESHLEGVVYVYGGLQSQETIGYAVFITSRGNTSTKERDDTNISNSTSFPIWHLLPGQEISMMGGEVKLIKTSTSNDRVIKNVGKIQTIPQAGNRFMR